eukprot:3608892-Alexandrium_andersonii.AAC.1
MVPCSPQDRVKLIRRSMEAPTFVPHEGERANRGSAETLVHKAHGLLATLQNRLSLGHPALDVFPDVMLATGAATQGANTKVGHRCMPPHSSTL